MDGGVCSNKPTGVISLSKVDQARAQDGGAALPLVCHYSKAMVVGVTSLTSSLRTHTSGWVTVLSYITATPLELPPATLFSHTGSLPSPSTPYSAVKLKGKLCECRAAVYGLSTPASAPELPLDLPIPPSNGLNRDDFPIGRPPPISKVLLSIALNIILVQPVPLIKFALDSSPLDGFSPVRTFAPDLPLEGAPPIFCLLIARHQRVVAYEPV
jgi:hypothetical protein